MDTTDPCIRQAQWLLSNVRDMGVQVRRRGDALMIRDLEGRLTDLLREQMGELRPQLLALLDGAETVSQFAQSGKRLVVRCAALDGALIVLAADNADLDSELGTRWRRGRGLPPDVPVYRARELLALVGVGPEHLRWIHEVKTTFSGEVAL